VIKAVRPIQIVNIFDKIKNCLAQQKYTQTKHALQRQDERKIDLQDAIYVLKTGRHERTKTSFDNVHNTWKYAIRGKTVDHVELRIIIAFDEAGMIIITAMEVA
jgi:hypothetical protein